LFELLGRPFGHNARALRKTISYLGPGFFVTIGFIDPGNWATNVAAGSACNYDLLWVVLLGTIILILWQHMAAHLGIIKGRSLAEAIRDNTRPWVAAVYGVTIFAACIATALAEILGAAIGLEILLHIPLDVGAIIVTILIAGALWFHRYHLMEKVIIVFVSVIGLAYLAELYLVKPNWNAAMVHTFVPSVNSGNILIALGVLGAVVMPHNLYLHSEVIQNREWGDRSEGGMKRLLRYEFLDTIFTMIVGMVINMAMIVVAAAVFFKHHVLIDNLSQASATLTPIAGNLAGHIFGIGLLFAGIASAMTAGMAGGTVMNGFLKGNDGAESKLSRAGMTLTLGIACILILLVHDTFRALVLSQVCLSIQLPFTMLPLYLLTSSRRVMGDYATGWLEKSAMVVTGVAILFMNALLVWQLLGGRF